MVDRNRYVLGGLPHTYLEYEQHVQAHVHTDLCAGIANWLPQRIGHVDQQYNARSLTWEKNHRSEVQSRQTDRQTETDKTPIIRHFYQSTGWKGLPRHVLWKKNPIKKNTGRVFFARWQAKSKNASATLSQYSFRTAVEKKCLSARSARMRQKTFCFTSAWVRYKENFNQ